MISNIREFIKYEVIKRKMEKIIKIIETIFEQKCDYLKEDSFIEEVKNYIKVLNFDESEKICELNFSFKRIMKIITLLIKENKIDWLNLTSEETISISSYLYYMKNKNT